RQLGEHVEHWLDVEGSWPTPWRNALGLSDTAVLVTPEQLQQMQQEIGDVLARYRHRGDGDPRARTVAAYTVYFPRDLEPVPDETEPG
ncbi:hypothetical protein, partial [Auraticoccus cholistanensis]|uniref:hypothetical protein n=1 Tax=Auraticoccus cholistanensis TaxID=2656650 RepID=UPI0018D263F9